jgi:hypothetical protein
MAAKRRQRESGVIEVKAEISGVKICHRQPGGNGNRKYLASVWHIMKMAKSVNESEIIVAKKKSMTASLMAGEKWLAAYGVCQRSISGEEESGGISTGGKWQWRKRPIWRQA